MMTRSSLLRERPRRYSNRPRLANRRTRSPISLSIFRLADEIELSGSPMRSSFARSAAAALNVPKPTEWPSKQAMMSPFASASSLMRRRSRAEAFAGAADCTLFGAGAGKPGSPSGVWVNRIELVFLQGPVTQSELDRHIVKPAGREASIEMTQARNDHADDRRLDVGARLIEDEEMKARLLREGDAGRHLFACVEMAKLRAELRSDHRIAARGQIEMVLQTQGSGSVKARFFPRPAAHETQG